LRKSRKAQLAAGAFHLQGASISVCAVIAAARLAPIFPRAVGFRDIGIMPRTSALPRRFREDGLLMDLLADELD
jgi:hypothetical protein